MTTFNPDLWTETFHRALKTYVDSVVDSDIYEVVYSYPAADDLDRLLPLAKTLIHFDIADITEGPLGFGENYVDGVWDESLPAPPGQTVEYWEAHVHEVEMDVGIWASAESGGVTSRLEARTILSQLFTGYTAYANCLLVTDGIHIQRFGGGRNLIDAFGDIPLWRMVDIGLSLKVFSRYKVPAVPYIASTDQAPAVEIGGVTIVG